MLRLALRAALFMSAATVGAQGVPGRDLLTYPLGLSGEAQAFGSGAASGLWNPATALVSGGERGRLAIAALNAPIDLGLTAVVLHAAIRKPIGKLSLSFARASVTDLVHTETDPQSVGNEIEYSTWVLSLGLARRIRQHVVAGVALRWQAGHVYDRTGSALATDAGVVFDGLTTRDLRIALSGFLWTIDSRQSPTLFAAADVRVAGEDTLRTVRAGFGISRTRSAVTEWYPYVDGRAGKVTVRGGPVRMDAYGSSSWRLRIALLLRHAGYTIGVVREDNANGLAPTYQMTVANVLR